MGPSLSDLGLLARMAKSMKSAANTIVLAKRQNSQNKQLNSLLVWASAYFLAVSFGQAYTIFTKIMLCIVFIPKKLSSVSI
jgi:hypothetical protein